MTASKRASGRALGSDLARVAAHVIKPHEYVELPELTDDMLARGRVNRGGRPRSKNPPTKAQPTPTPDTAPLFDELIRSPGGWRSETLTEVRRLIHEADPDIVEEECKWAKASNPLGVPVWSHAGIVCTGEAYKQVVKLTFARGASLADPRKLFNASLDGNTRRAIDIREGDSLDAKAFKALIRAAIAENLRSSATKSKGRGRT